MSLAISMSVFGSQPQRGGSLSLPREWIDWFGRSMLEPMCRKDVKGNVQCLSMFLKSTSGAKFQLLIFWHQNSWELAVLGKLFECLWISWMPSCQLKFPNLWTDDTSWHDDMFQGLQHSSPCTLFFDALPQLLHFRGECIRHRKQKQCVA